ncbi:uncharacterized protein [Primulina eburnea]|uniref:uncharacterized protein isoform X1 n=2 Tax=Primulina eburnea TaxID=1245227 RepID=UPI003C6C1961
MFPRFGLNLLQKNLNRRPNMASSTPDSPVSDANKNCNSSPKSHFLKTVCLSDWWLVKAESDSQGGGLSVSGFTSREQRAMRVFSSAPILKSHDMFTLETTDGICVLIKGFINKARTLENGFPSDVFNHFVFGFPPYWKEHAEKCMGEQSCVDSNERGIESQHEMDAERNSSKTKSSTITLPKKCDGEFGSSEDNTSVFSIALVNLERTFSSGNCVNGDHMTADRSVNCSIKNASTPSRFGGHANISPDIGILSACHLTNENRRTKGRTSPGSCCKVQMKHKTTQILNPISGGYRTRSKSVLMSACEKEKLESVNFEPRGRKNLYCGGIGFKEPIEISETPNQAKDGRIAQTKGSMDQAIHKGTTSQDRHGAGDNEEHAVANESSISEKDGMSKMKTKRKLAYETPGSKMEGVLSGSSKSLNLSRSRSGRLLMPTLKFWCNERALYDAEGNITGIEDEVVPKHPIKGKDGKRQRRKRHLT